MKMLKVQSWEKFRSSGLLWWINMILHTFGWAIVYEFYGKSYKNNKRLKRVYPARVKFRGFYEKSNSIGYTKVTRYLKRNVKQLDNECKLQ